MALVIEALAEKAVSSLLEAVTSLLREKVDLILNAKHELKKLQRKLERLEVSLKDADRKPFFSSERDRYLEGELKVIFYDAQDIIEKYETKIKISKREKDSLTSWNKVRKPWITLSSCFKEHVRASYKFSNETKKINERLDEIKKEWDMVVLLKTIQKVSREGLVSGEHDNPRETTHHIGEQSHMGREEDKKVIVKKLLSDDSAQISMTKTESVSIISIVGKGGIGKTTLAKMVFSEIEQQFGERRWWVCVSERPNREDLLRKILKEVFKESKEYNNMKLSDLCTELQKELPKGKFLLVLDDVWELQWWEEEVKRTLMGGATGSKILITSRNEDVSFRMHASHMHKLQEFNFKESWDLFLEEALSDGQTEQDLVKQNVKDVGESIVKKCGGLPLAIKTVGSMMHTKKMSREGWKFVEASKIWEWNMSTASSSSTEIVGDILPALMLSYDDLPYYLKSCFVYCCIYPKDYEIEKERLIRQWVAYGLIEEKEGIDVKVTANQYIEALIRRCLIEEIDLEKIKLHDILHDLALYIGGREYSHASTSQRTRHMSLLAVDNVEEAMHNATATAHKLRTLLDASSSHLTNFKWLRVLSLRGYRMAKLPKSIECLLLLKYLDLCNSNVRRLPSSIGKLCNLQTLDLSCSGIEELPKEMGELCNLRYLGLKDTEELKFIAEGMWKLTNLRTLHRFKVCNDKGRRRGCNIRELKDLKKLKGKLSIEGLGRSRKTIDDVGNAQLLKEKHDIISLEFSFENTGGDDEQSGVLEALEPPLGLESLGIYFYEGKVPTWLLNPEYTMLHTLILYGCFSWEKQISITSLKVLQVISCSTLCEIASMPALERLQVEYCDSLEQLSHHMPALKSLNVCNCDRLKTLPNMPALEWLEVTWCGSLEQLPHHMPALKLLSLLSCKMLKAVGDIPALESLTLSGMHVDEVPEWVWGLSQLEELSLYSFSKDISLGGHWQCLPKLRELRLYDFPNLKSLVDVNNITPQEQQNETTCPTDAQQQIACLSNLQELSIRKCPALHLPQELKDRLGYRLC